MAYAYPLMLDVSRRLIVIVGGGGVAARKAAGVIEAGAKRVTVIAPEHHEKLRSLPVKLVVEHYQPGHLDGSGLVFAATHSPEVNAAVVRDAQARGVLVSRADGDDELPGDFITPARFSSSAVTIAVSAGSPALAARVRDELKTRFDPSWGKMAEAMESLRPEILASGRDRERRTTLFRALAGDDAMSVLDSGGIDALRDWIAKAHL